MPIPVLVKALLSHRRAKPAGDGRCGGFCGILFFCQIRTLKLFFAVILAENGGVTGKIIPSKNKAPIPAMESALSKRILGY